MKTLHRLNRKNKLLNDFYVFDTETKGLRAKPDAFIFGVVYGWDYQKVIYSVKDFIKEFPEAYPCSGFFVIDMESKDNKNHFDFFVPKDKKIFSINSRLFKSSFFDFGSINFL